MISRVSVLVMFTMIFSLLLGSVPILSATGTTYYVDSVAGNDYNDGTSTNTPWKTLTKVNSVTFAAGDQILLKADSIWSSQLVLHGSGTSATPNKVGVYGTGNKPIINAGSVHANQNAAILLDSIQYWEIDGLEITNNDGVVDANWHNGIVASAMDYGTVNHIYITNCYIHDIGSTTFSAPVKPTNGATFGDIWANGNWSQDTNCILFKALKGSYSVPTKYNDIKVENNTLVGNNTYGNVITIASEWAELSGQLSTLFGPFAGSTNISIKSNDISQSRWGAIQPRVIDGSVGNGAVIECNLIHDIGTCNGLYTEFVKYMTIQYNEICRNSFSASASDMCGVDLDNETSNTTAQYNYIHDMTDAMFEIISLGNSDFQQAHYAKDNIIRYNISQNNKGLKVDGTGNPIGASCGKFILFAGGNVTGNKVYNNVDYRSTAITAPKVIIVLNHDQPISGNYAYNNIFLNKGANTYTFDTNGITYDYNCYNGFATTPGGAHSITSAPSFMDPGTAPSGNTQVPTIASLRTDVAGYKLTSSSPCINNGVNINTLWPGEVTGETDLWGNALYNSHFAP